ncbi:MAG: flagellar basal body L-ring protein FlgH [Planctomycetes bacterium]|nr:flagellar basal body L-ring protein FlgH [Planctomycetota bacterium]
MRLRGCSRTGVGALAGVLLALATPELNAQTSSLRVRKSQAEASQTKTPMRREVALSTRNNVYDQYALTTLTPVSPKAFRPGDLVTIIVREQRTFEADADLETKRQYDAKSELDSFVKPTEGGLGSSAFRRGKPNIDYKLDLKLKAEGDTKRQDKLTTRLTAEIIDVKPNGLLVLEARGRIEHDDEVSLISLTGVCRKEDVTADNTVLSTQIADKNVVVRNEGALKASSTRGWIPRLIDWLKPI